MLYSPALFLCSLCLLFVDYSWRASGRLSAQIITSTKAMLLIIRTSFPNLPPHLKRTPELNMLTGYEDWVAHLLLCQILSLMTKFVTGASTAHDLPSPPRQKRLYRIISHGFLVG